MATLDLTSWLGGTALGQIPVVSGSWKVSEESGVDIPGSIEFSVPATPDWIPVAPDQDLLHAYFHELVTRFPDCKVGKDGAPRDHHEEPLDWECKIGQCGLCTVEIVEGAENFVPPDPGGMEKPTIEKVRQLDWDPKKYRLACVAKIKGPVKLTIPPA